MSISLLTSTCKYMYMYFIHIFIYMIRYNQFQRKTNFLQERFPIITVIFELIPTIPLSFSFLCLLQLAVCMLYNPTALPEKIKFICKNMLLVIKSIYMQHF